MNQERAPQNPELPEDSIRRLEALIKSADEYMAGYRTQVQKLEQGLGSLGPNDAVAAETLRMQLEMINSEIDKWEQIKSQCQEQMALFRQAKDKIRGHLTSKRPGQEN